jgi:hydroxymethylglutaryl-CoA lyase
MNGDAYGRAGLDGLPSRVTVYEVGPRDGLQNESTLVPVAVKAEFIARLIDAGHTSVEVTSFVHPKWVPQLADAEQLLEALPDIDGVRLPVLVPNERGLDRALALGVRDIAVFGSATETFAQRNVNRTVDESLTMFAPVVARAREEGLGVRGYLSMCFGDPWEGEVPLSPMHGASPCHYARPLCLATPSLRRTVLPTHRPRVPAGSAVLLRRFALTRDAARPSML